MLIPSKVTRIWSWTSKRQKNAQIAGIGSAALFYVSKSVVQQQISLMYTTNNEKNLARRCARKKIFKSTFRVSSQISNSRELDSGLGQFPTKRFFFQLGTDQWLTKNEGSITSFLISYCTKLSVSTTVESIIFVLKKITALKKRCTNLSRSPLCQNQVFFS